MRGRRGRGIFTVERKSNEIVLFFEKCRNEIFKIILFFYFFHI